jgi:hopene-associated glycosyltransferase HpnB
MTTLSLLALFGWVGLIAFRGRFWLSEPELQPSVPRETPPVAIVVPARDEADVIALSLGSLLAQDYAGALRIVLVDDGSGDGTGAIARALPGAERLTVIDGARRPPGWAGKTWALRQGVAATSEDLILLTDADVVHDPEHVATLVARIERGGIDLVSEMVALRCESGAERALIPAFVYFFQLLFPFAKVNDALHATAAAAGGTILLRRRALARIGGIEAIKGALIDDVALGAAVKRGGRIWLGHSGLARSIRRYPDARHIWRMIARSAYVQLRLSPLMLGGAVFGLFVLFAVPPIAALFGRGTASTLGWMAWLAQAISFLPTVWRFRLCEARALSLPALAAFYVAATVGSAIDHHRGRGVVWKARAYPGKPA